MEETQGKKKHKVLKRVLIGLVILILLVPYIRHYYILENEVQKMYMQYDRILRLYRMAESSGTLVPHK